MEFVNTIKKCETNMGREKHEQKIKMLSVYKSINGNAG